MLDISYDTDLLSFLVLICIFGIPFALVCRVLWRLGHKR